MIVSDAPPHIIAHLRHLAGPNPEGSKLTNNERLHLIYHLTTMIGAVRTGPSSLGHSAVRLVRIQLNERGLSNEEISELCASHLFSNTPLMLADAIAVHPSLQSLDYLD